MSDLQIDGRHPSPLMLPDEPPDCDGILIAGGIASDLEASLQWIDRSLRRRCRDRPIIMVPGNEDYWNGRPMAETLARGRDLARSLGITLLSDETTRLVDRQGRGVHIVGATLWTDWGLNGSNRATIARGFARGSWPDCQRIVLTAHRHWSPHVAAGAHARSRAYIEDALTSIVCQEHGIRPSPTSLVMGVRPGDRAVVLTHHAPSRRSLPEDWAGWCSTGRWLPTAHASDLEPIMLSWGAPTLWVHGHVPGAADYRVGKCRVVANPRSVGRTDPFDPALVVEV